MNVLAAVDPGPRPGLAYKIGDKYFSFLMESPDALYAMLKEQPPTRIAVELFARSERIDKHMIKTMECVGGVKACAVMLGIPVHGQRHQQRISYNRDAEPLMLKGAAVHEKAAMAHLLFMEDKLKDGTYK